MITEDYVSFEVAKLLKEKGFNELCRYIWIFDKANDPQDTDGISKLCAEQLIDGSFIDNSGINKAAEYGDWFKDYHKVYLCPTLQMAMKWLREVHNIHIEIVPICVDDSNDDLKWHYGWAVKTTIFIDRWKRHNAEHISYEQACEAAIRYCLTNLI